MKQIKRQTVKMFSLVFFMFSSIFSIGLALEHAFFYPLSPEMHVVWTFALLALAFAVLFLAVEPKRRELMSQISELIGEERKLVEEQKLKINELEKEKLNFIDVAGHELKSLLTPILPSLHLMNKDEARFKEALPIFLKNFRRMVVLTDDMLALARIDAGRKKISPDQMGREALASWLRELANEVIVPILHRLERETDFLIEIESFSEIVTDFKGLKLILSNLFSNAAKYTKSGQIQILVSQRQDVVVFEVEDTGIGIAQENHERIFEPFERAHNLEVESTGLGLSIARRMTQMLGGTLAVESKLGEGSNFILRLPNLTKNI